jgi:small subunit ribosomal protein S16
VAVKIRLRRVGAKKQPAYRIVIADSRAPRDGRFIEIVGAYNPLTHPSTITIDNERALYWLRQGAQPTEVVLKMLKRLGVWSAFTGEPMPEMPAAPAPAVEVAAPVAQEVIPSEEEAPSRVETAPEETPAAEEPAVPAEEEAPAAEEAIAVEETTPAAEETPAPAAEESAPAE